MIKVTHSYGVELDWVEPLAKQMKGTVEGNFIKVPEYLYTGYRYVLNCQPGISALYVDVSYNSDIQLRQENKTKDFVGIYYNLTEGDAAVMSDEASNPVGRWNYNLVILDSSLASDYIVKTGNKTFALCIFIKKEIIKEYFLNNPSLKDHTEEILNPDLNTIVKFTRMSNYSHHVLMNLRTKEIGGPAFDFHLQGAVQCLLADYIEKMTFDEVVLEKMDEIDLKDILKSQSYLIENIDKNFPSIESLAQQANMSTSKYKNLFRKITGLTPNAFFLNNKLIEAKRLLMNRQFSIMEVSYNLSFTSNSYFTVKFKEFFGMSPKDFINQLQ